MSQFKNFGKQGAEMPCCQIRRYKKLDFPQAFAFSLFSFLIFRTRFLSHTFSSPSWLQLVFLSHLINLTPSNSFNGQLQAWWRSSLTLANYSPSEKVPHNPASLMKLLSLYPLVLYSLLWQRMPHSLAPLKKLLSFFRLQRFREVKRSEWSHPALYRPGFSLFTCQWANIHSDIAAIRYRYQWCHVAICARNR